MRNLRALIAIALCMAACGPGAGGPAGQQGPVGPQGPQGPQGAGTFVVSSRYCSAQSGNIGRVNLTYEYQVIRYSNGEALVICSVSDSSRSYGTERYCRAGSACLQGAACDVTYDVDTPSGGYMEFRADYGALPGTMSEGVQYHDPPSPYDAVTIRYNTGNCY